MSAHEIPLPVKTRFFTTGTKILFGVMAAGFLVYGYRLVAGLGAVTNLTDQYDIRGLSQHRPQYSIERQLNVISNLARIHPRKVVFNRVLRRNNLLVGRI